MERVKGRWLVVEDDARLRASLTDALAARGADVTACATVADALRELGASPVEGAVLDVVLPDGDATDVVERALACPTVPAIVAISGSAAPEVSFRLAQLGVRAFLPKPVRLDELDAAIDDALANPPDLKPHLRAAVGRAKIHDVEDEVRATMVDEAVARAKGSRREAARILRISRQLLQHILRRR